MKICPFCHIGKVESKKVVYVQWNGPDAVVVDRIPALTCDTCGEKTYDSDAMESLQRLLLTTTPNESSSRISR